MAGLSFFFSSRRRHTRYIGDWSSDVCSSDLPEQVRGAFGQADRGTGGDRRVLRPQGGHRPGVCLVRIRGCRDEIGRASCRERVLISGGRGGVRKNRETIVVAGPGELSSTTCA